MSIKGTIGYLIQGGKHGNLSSYPTRWRFLIYVELAGMYVAWLMGSLLSNSISASYLKREKLNCLSKQL